MAVLDQAVQAALTYQPPSPAQVAALLEKTRGLAQNGKFERFKTSADHDGTEKHPEWLEGASI